MSDNEFGFSDEAANREADPFAGMSEEEFRLLLDLSTQIMEKQGVTDRSEAIDLARKAKETCDRIVMPGSGRVGIRKYGTQEFFRLVMRELTDGKEPCQHGHMEPITFCGTCEKQSRIDKHVQNPTKRRCLHTRIDLPPWDPSNPDQKVPPCTACQHEEDEEALAYELQKREEYDAKMQQLKKQATTPPAMPVDHLQQLLNATGQTTHIRRLQDMEAEMNALIGILLDKLGGEATLGPEDMERFKELTRLGESTYSVTPSTTTIELIVERRGPTGRRPVLPFSTGGYIKPHTVGRSNPSAIPSAPAWMTAGDADDDEDLPF